MGLVDQKKLAFQTAVELSYLSEDEQEELEFTMGNLKCFPSLTQASALKKYSQQGELTRAMIELILDDVEEKPVKLALKADMRSYFPVNTSKTEMETVILSLLEDWKNKQT